MPIANEVEYPEELGSPLERSFEYYLAALGGDLPPHEKQHIFHPDRRWRFDYAWVASRVAVELEGGSYGSTIQCHSCGATVRATDKHGQPGKAVRVLGYHARFTRYYGDMEKYNAAAALGWLLLRFSRRHLDQDPAQVVGEIKQAVHQRGNRVKMVEEISGQEHRVLLLMAGGFQQKEIAVRLGVSENTIRRHAENILSKLQARNRTAAVARAMTWGLISPDDIPYAELLEILEG